METGRTIESNLADVTGLSLGSLRESHDEALEAGLRRLLRLVSAPDIRLGTGEKRRRD